MAHQPLQTSLPTQALTNLPAVPQPDAPAAHRPPRTRTQASSAALEEGEHFDLTNVSGSEDDADEDTQPAHCSSIQAIATTARGDSNQINDPSLPLPSNAALDVHYFFEKVSDQNVCKECRQVPCPPYFGFVIYQDKTHRKAHDADPRNFRRRLNGHIHPKPRPRPSIPILKDITLRFTRP
jgi:hypothetical protein